MAQLHPYLNFMGNTEEAFNFYKSLFDGEFISFQRFSDVPGAADNLPENEKNKIMHIALKINDSITLMATDMLASIGQKLVEGNNFTISLNPDTKEEADRLYKELSEGGTDTVAPHDEFWGYWGTCKDRFGIRWMFNVMKQQ